MSDKNPESTISSGAPGCGDFGVRRALEQRRSQKRIIET